MRPTRLRALIPLVVLAAGLAACGDNDDEDVGDVPPVVDETPAEPEPTPTPTPTPTPEPTPTEEVYEIQSGDTLSAIAQRFDVTVDALVEANDIDDPDAIVVGEELVVPLGD